MKRIKLISAIALLSSLGVCSAADDAAKKNPNEVFTPEQVLPSGADSTTSTNPYTGESGPARKGTVAATLNNIALLNNLLSEKESPENEAKIETITEAIASLLPSLRVIGVFDMFTPEEWLSTKDQQGRALAAILYLQKYPQSITPSIKRHLERIRDQTKNKIILEAIDLALRGAKY